MTKITLKRIAKKEKYTIGKLYIDGVYFCDTLEDKDRGLSDSMSVAEIRSKKIYGETAIPTGTYRLTTSVISPKFSKYPFYMSTCGGKLPRVLDVKGFDGILLHVGDGSRAQNLTYGCVLVGENKYVGQLNNGKEVFKNLIDKLKGCDNITLEII